MNGIDLAVASGETVVLVGESGSGKNVLARRIHQRSPRHQRCSRRAMPHQASTQTGASNHRTRLLTTSSAPR